MKKLIIAAFVLAWVAYTPKAQTSKQLLNKTFKEIGKIYSRNSSEIKVSDLWIGGEVLDRDLCSYDAYKEYLGELGAKKIRLQSGWAKTEKQKGIYDFEWLDHIINDAISRGIQPWIQISYGNPIYEGGGGASLNLGMITSDVALEAFAKYAKVLVLRYKDRISEWEIWNEPDGHSKPKDENIYANLFIKTADAIKSVQPESKIIALSLAGVHKPEFVEGFFKYLKDSDKLDLVDVITFHGYPKNPDDNFDGVDKLIAISKKYKSDIEFWQGETGCPSTLGSTGALSNYPWTEHSQAKWNLRRALAHIGRGYKFSLFLLSEFVYNDEMRKGLNSKGILKIDESDYSIKYAKLAYFAYQNLCSVYGRELELIKEKNYNAITDSSLSVFVWKGHENMLFLAYWKNNRIPTDNDHYFDFDLELKSTSFKNPVLVNPFNGKILSIPRRNQIKKKQNILFKDIPCYDSPLLIVEKRLIEIEK